MPLTGLLTLTGSLDLSQFWPSGTSDADTATVVVKDFRFQQGPHSQARRTHVFDTASVRGKGGAKTVINPKKHSVTIRFQGIDAPELHYQPQSVLSGAKRSGKQGADFLKYRGDFRQLQGETSAAGLGRLLGRTGTIACTVTSRVEHPNDCFDMYGRLIGNVHVRLGGKMVDANIRLLELGLAVPTFYVSMAPDEIAAALHASEKARQRGAGGWGLFSKDASKFDAKLRFRRPPVKVDAKGDAPANGAFVMPKIFRRLSTWAVNKKAGMVAGSFHDYLGAHVDYVFERDAFLAQGQSAAPVKRLDEYVDKKSRCSFMPGDLVFREGASTLLDAKGKAVTGW